MIRALILLAILFASDAKVLSDADECEPGPVTNLQITADTNSLVISWEPPEYECATSYFITLGTSSEEEAAETTDTTYEFQNLESCTSYTVAVSARSESGNGESVSAVETTTTPANIGGVTDLEFVAFDDALNVTWEAPSQQEACIREYRVLLWDDDAYTSEIKTSEKHCQFRPLVGCTTYHVQITPEVGEAQEGALQQGEHKLEALPTKPPTLESMRVSNTWVEMTFAVVPFVENRCTITKVSLSCEGVDNDTHDAFLNYVDMKSRPDAVITVNGLSEYMPYTCVAVVENEGGISENSEPITFLTLETKPTNIDVTYG